MQLLRGQGNRQRAFSLVFAGLFLAVILMPLFAADAAEAARVTPSSTSLPLARLGAATVSAGEHGIFIIGGRTATGYLDNISKYDPKTGELIDNWHQLPPVNIEGQTQTIRARQSVAAVWSGRYIYVFGGAALTDAPGLNGETINNMPRSIEQIVQIDPVARTAVEVPGARFYSSSASSTGSGAFGASAVWVPSSAKCPQGCAYVFGGFQFNYPTAATRLNTVLKFNPNPGIGESRVSIITDRLPYPLQDSAASWNNDRKLGYLFGGLANLPTSCVPDRDQTRCPTDSILVFDPAREVTTISPSKLPERTQFAAAASTGKEVYVFGGRRIDGSASDLISVYNVNSDSVVALSLTLTSPRYAMQAATWRDTTTGEDRIFLAGGRDAGVFSNGFTDILEFIPGVTGPTAPRSLQARLEGSSLNVTWMAPSYDGGSPVLGYKLYRCEGTVEHCTRNAYLFAQIAERQGASGSALRFLDTDVLPGETYTYQVAAYNMKGTTVLNGVRSEAIQAFAGVRAPGPVRNLYAAGGDNSVTLQWDVPANDGGLAITRYNITRTSDGETAYFSATGTSFRNTQLMNGRAYSYTVRAVNDAGLGDASATVTAVPAPVPAAPSNVRATTQPFGTTQVITLAWDRPEGDFLRGYQVYRSAGNGPLERVANLTDETVTAWTDHQVQAGIQYSYAVSANNTVGVGPRSDVIPVAILTAPRAPRNLQAFSQDGYVHLRWDALTKDEMGGDTSVIYIVHRRIADGAWESAGRSPGNAFRDSTDNVSAGDTYEYAVTALNAEHSSVRSQPVSILVRAPVHNTAPVANLLLLKTVGKIGEPILFDASYSHDAEDLQATEYWFDFGDGTNSGWVRTPAVYHTYGENSTNYRVWVKVRDSRGLESAESPRQLLIIGNPPREKDQDGGDGPRAIDITKPVEKANTWGFIPTPAWVPLVALGAAAAIFGARRSRVR